MHSFKDLQVLNGNEKINVFMCHYSSFVDNVFRHLTSEKDVNAQDCIPLSKQIESLPCLERTIHQRKYETKFTPSVICKGWVVLYGSIVLFTSPNSNECALKESGFYSGLNFFLELMQPITGKSCSFNQFSVLQSVSPPNNYFAASQLGTQR